MLSVARQIGECSQERPVRLTCKGLAIELDLILHVSHSCTVEIDCSTFRKDWLSCFRYITWLRLTVENDLGRCLTSGDMLTVSNADCDPVDDPVSFTEDCSPTLGVSIRVGEVVDEGRSIIDSDVPARLHDSGSEKTIQDRLVVRNERESMRAKRQCHFQSDSATRVQESRVKGAT